VHEAGPGTEGPRVHTQNVYCSARAFSAVEPPTRGPAFQQCCATDLAAKQLELGLIGSHGLSLLWGRVALAFCRRSPLTSPPSDREAAAAQGRSRHRRARGLPRDPCGGAGASGSALPSPASSSLSAEATRANGARYLDDRAGPESAPRLDARRGLVSVRSMPDRRDLRLHRAPRSAARQRAFHSDARPRSISTRRRRQLRRRTWQPSAGSGPTAVV
jgi:hypothetical protein